MFESGDDVFIVRGGEIIQSIFGLGFALFNSPPFYKTREQAEQALKERETE